MGKVRHSAIPYKPMICKENTRQNFREGKLGKEEVQPFLQELFLFAYPANTAVSTDEEHPIIVYLERFMYIF